MARRCPNGLRQVRAQTLIIQPRIPRSVSRLSCLRPVFQRRFWLVVVLQGRVGGGFLGRSAHRACFGTAPRGPRIPLGGPGRVHCELRSNAHGKLPQQAGFPLRD